MHTKDCITPDVWDEQTVTHVLALHLQSVTALWHANGVTRWYLRACRKNKCDAAQKKEKKKLCRVRTLILSAVGSPSFIGLNDKPNCKPFYTRSGNLKDIHLGGLFIYEQVPENRLHTLGGIAVWLTCPDLCSGAESVLEDQQCPPVARSFPSTGKALNNGSAYLGGFFYWREVGKLRGLFLKKKKKKWACSLIHKASGGTRWKLRKSPLSGHADPLEALRLALLFSVCVTFLIFGFKLGLKTKLAVRAANRFDFVGRYQIHPTLWAVCSRTMSATRCGNCGTMIETVQIPIALSD